MGVIPAGRDTYVLVDLYSGRTHVASERIRTGRKYRFSVSAGSYQVKGWWGSDAVAVQAGRVVTFNMVDTCT
jgi:hypothetical protein